MNVAELIAELQALPPDLDVWLESECCGCSVLARDVIQSDTLAHHGTLSDADFVAVSG